MINIIKTAIITIIISIISGLLLERLKNLAPKILCNIGNATPMEMNNKKVYAYVITVSNISNKTIHDLTLNVQSSQSNLKISDAKITKGLKFDSSIKDNILDVNIPFLSKNDEFSVTLYVESQHGVNNKPVVIIRSPEKFKQVDSVEQKGVIDTVVNKPKNRGKIKKSKNSTKNKKVIIAGISIILVMLIVGLAKFYLKGTSTNTQIPSVKTDEHNQDKDKDTIDSKYEKAKNKDKNRVIKNEDGKTLKGETNKNQDEKTSINGANKNQDGNVSNGETNKNLDEKTPIDGTNKNTDTKTSTDGTTRNTDTKTSTGGATGNTDTKASTGGTTGNTGN